MSIWVNRCISDFRKPCISKKRLVVERNGMNSVTTDNVTTKLLIMQGAFMLQYQLFLSVNLELTLSVNVSLLGVFYIIGRNRADI